MKINNNDTEPRVHLTDIYIRTCFPIETSKVEQQSIFSRQLNRIDILFLFEFSSRELFVNVYAYKHNIRTISRTARKNIFFQRSGYNY